jgi:hypothetical protein
MTCRGNRILVEDSNKEWGGQRDALAAREALLVVGIGSSKRTLKDVVAPNHNLSRNYEYAISNLKSFYFLSSTSECHKDRAA